jgi:hypothetical protein
LERSELHFSSQKASHIRLSPSNKSPLLKIDISPQSNPEQTQYVSAPSLNLYLFNFMPYKQSSNFSITACSLERGTKKEAIFLSTLNHPKKRGFPERCQSAEISF